MANEHYKSLADLVNCNLLGGTFVEYLDGYEFDQELGRGVIKEIGVKEDEFFVDTSTEGLIWRSNLEAGRGLYNITEKEGVFYVEFAFGAYRALAPKGVEIPKPKQ